MSAEEMFFSDVVIGAEVAPAHILKAAKDDCNYRSIVKKRLGCITADDFLKCARRFAALCKQEYLECRVDFRVNKDIPIGQEVYFAGQGIWEGAPGEEIDGSRLTVDAFRKIFAVASTMTLQIRLVTERDGLQSSFSQIEWTCDRSKTIFFYA